MGRKRTLTQNQVLEAIESLIVEAGVSPTVSELREKLGVGSNRTVFRYLAWLEREGAIDRWSGARGIRLRRGSDRGLETRSIPVLGTAPAGPLMLAEESWEGVVRVPTQLLSPVSGSFFLLRVRGDSMNRAQVHGDLIEDGDLVLVRHQSIAESGDVVVALIDGEVTIKRFSQAQGYVALKPESTNRSHKPVVAGPGFQIQGVVCRVLKAGARLIEDEECSS